MSHPVWVRGLKHVSGCHSYTFRQSHPVWVRGLKLPLLGGRYLRCVAPRVGAWIET